MARVARIQGVHPSGVFVRTSSLYIKEYDLFLSLAIYTCMVMAIIIWSCIDTQDEEF